jgi:hypothetical protein
MNFDINTPKKPKNTVIITGNAVRWGEDAIAMPNAPHIKT